MPSHHDPSPGPDASAGLNHRVQQARVDVEQHVDPTPPPIAQVRARARSRQRRVAGAATGVVIVIALLAAVLATRHTTRDSSRPAAQRPTTALPFHLVRSSEPRSAGDAKSIPAAVEAETAFSADLVRQLAKAEPGNFFVSPHSIAVALSMTLAGTSGATKSQLERALHLTIPEPTFHDAMNALDLALSAPRKQSPTTQSPGVANRSDPLQLAVASSLWGQAGYPFRRQFLDRLAQSYDAGMNTVDFIHSAEASRQRINSWVARQTHGQIIELIPRDLIDELTRLVLVNTITFKASWIERFRTATPGPFTTSDGTIATAQMMSGGSGAGAVGAGWRSVAIPYDGGAHLVVIMPTDITRFELTPQVLQAAGTAHEELDVTMPKFSITSRIQLKPTLEALGVSDAFDPHRADLSRMDGTRNLYVSAVVHQATITVDEKGTSAAAATAVIAKFSSKPGELIVDHPFLFAIRDDATGAILFLGLVTNPTTSS
ncbi:MAG: serpin family protein [Acidimicrobiales bacterium]|nr:serpin family protein [Acidimicrobiales bacterium]